MSKLEGFASRFDKCSMIRSLNLRKGFSTIDSGPDEVEESNDSLPLYANILQHMDLEAHPTIKNLRLDDFINGFEVCRKVEADSETYFVLVSKTSYCLNFEKFFSNDYFVTPEILARYIRFRNMKIVELELRFMAQMIYDNKWAAVMFEKYSDALLILSNVFAELDFSNLDTFLETLLIVEKIGILANKEVSLSESALGIQTF